MKAMINTALNSLIVKVNKISVKFSDNVKNKDSSYFPVFNLLIGGMTYSKTKESKLNKLFLFDKAADFENICVVLITNNQVIQYFYYIYNILNYK